MIFFAVHRALFEGQAGYVFKQREHGDPIPAAGRSLRLSLWTRTLLDADCQVLDDHCQASVIGPPGARGLGRPVIRNELIEQLVRVIDVRLLDPLEILLDGDDAVDALRRTVRARAQAWADRMLDGDERTATHAIVRVIATLYPGDGPFDPPAEWWRTPLGQAVVRRVGHPTAQAVSYSVAGAMLGITRQGVHDLVTRGKLERHPDGGVTPASVRDRLNRRSPTS